VTDGSSPFIHAYAWSYSGGWGSKYANPSALPPDYPTSVCFNPAGTVLGLSHQTSPYIAAYAWSNGFGSKFANPATLPNGSGSLSFAGNSDLIIGYGGINLTAYPWSSGFGTRYSILTIAGGLSKIAVNSTNNMVGFTTGGSSAPNVGAAAWSSGVGFGARYTNPSTYASGISTQIDFSN
jgi:hypothetical protein